MSWRTRAAAVGCATLLGGTMSVVGAGPAAGAGGGGETRTTEGRAYGLLPSRDTDIFVFLSIFDPPRRKPFAVVEVFANDASFECFNGRRIKADLDGLDEAEAEGRTKLPCGGPDPDFPARATARVTVDVDWTAYGDVITETYPDPQTGCPLEEATRLADLTGSVTVSIPALGVETEIVAGFGDLREITVRCPA